MKIKNRYLLLTAALLLLYYLPFFLLGENAYYNAFDNLDSYVVWYRTVIENGYAHASPSTIVGQFLGGIPKFTLVNSFSVYYLLNLALPTFQALNTLMIITSLVALAGMWLLLHTHWRLGPLPCAFLSLSFAFTPFLPAWTMSIAGQPLLLYAILNLRKDSNRWTDWLIVALFPFVSNFQSAGIFVVFLLFLLIIADFRDKRPVRKLVIASAVLLALYSFPKIDLFSNLLAGAGFVSHRTEMLRYSVPPWTCFKIFIRYFLYGNIDVALSLHTLVILPMVLFVFIKDTIKKKRPDHTLALILLSITCICAYIALLNWEPVVRLRNQSELLRMYSLDRFHIFLQLLWHLAAARCLILIGGIHVRKIVTVAFALQMLVAFAYQPTYYTYFVKPFITIKPYHYIYRYSDYYAVGMFDRIKEVTGNTSSSARIISLGIPPAIAQYNGMWTADGYVTTYPLSYKHKFREIMADELEKNVTIKGFFDEWGSQCILLYDQGDGGNFSTHVTRDRAPAPRDLRLNNSALKALNCKYMLSAEIVQNPRESGLSEIGRFSSAIWDLTLYEVK